MMEDCPSNEQLAEKRNFQGNCEILSTIFQNLSAKGIVLRYTSKPGRVYLFYIAPINFYSARALLW